MHAAALPIWSLVRQARERAGITQDELARRAGTSQSAIARYERARSMPDLATLDRLIRACGYQLRYELSPIDDSDVRLLDHMAQLTPAERLEQNRAMTAVGALAGAARSKGRVRRLPPRPDA